MTSHLSGSVWQLGHVRKGVEILAKSPYFETRRVVSRHKYTACTKATSRASGTQARRARRRRTVWETTTDLPWEAQRRKPAERSCSSRVRSCWKPPSAPARPPPVSPRYPSQTRLVSFPLLNNAICGEAFTPQSLISAIVQRELGRTDHGWIQGGTPEGQGSAVFELRVQLAQ